MPDERLNAALARIGTAIARIEEFVLAAPAPPQSELAERHERLRAHAADAIARIDRLLADADI